MSAGDAARQERARQARSAAAQLPRRELALLGLSVALCAALVSGLIG